MPEFSANHLRYYYDYNILENSIQIRQNTIKTKLRFEIANLYKSYLEFKLFDIVVEKINRGII